MMGSRKLIEDACIGRLLSKEFHEVVVVKKLMDMRTRKAQKTGVSRVIDNPILRGGPENGTTQVLQLNNAGTTAITSGCKSRYGNRPIDDKIWTFTVGRKGGGDGHAALIMEGWFDHGNWQEHWAQMAHWVPQKIDGQEATMDDMESGDIYGRVIEKWEGSMVGIQEHNQHKSYEELSAFSDFSQYQDTSTFTITAFNGHNAQNEIENDKHNPPKFHFYGINGAYNCASWVSKIGEKANVKIPSEDHFGSLLQLFGMPEMAHRPKVLIDNAREITSRKKNGAQTIESIFLNSDKQ